MKTDTNTVETIEVESTPKHFGDTEMGIGLGMAATLLAAAVFVWALSKAA